MAINLVKGQTINLDKSTHSLSTITIGLGWDVKKKKQGLLSSLFNSNGNDDYDLDAIAFMLNDKGKVENLGEKLINSDVIFFNNQKSVDGTVYSTGDNRTGAGEGDDEQIIVKLETVAARIHKILFLVSIYKGREKGQHFGNIENCFIRAVDAKGVEIARYDMSSDSTFSNMRSMVFAEVYRKDSSWKFRAIGEPKETDTFVDILKDYI